jgi:predicted RNase H-like HicB family nuclease
MARFTRNTYGEENADFRRASEQAQMKTTIPCKITYSKKDDCWYVESPGFYDGILTYGVTLEDAKNMAYEAVSGILASYLEHGDTFTIPKGAVSADWFGIEIDPGLAFALWLRRTRLSVT